MESANNTEVFTTALDITYCDEDFNFDSNGKKCVESTLNQNGTFEAESINLHYTNIDQREIAELSQRAVYHKPIMGTNALIAKITNSSRENDKQDSAIIEELVHRRFSDTLDYYKNRSLKRQISRTSATSTLTNTEDYHNGDEDAPREQLQFMVSVDETNIESSLENLASEISAQNLTVPSINTSVNAEYDPEDFLRAALGNEFTVVCDMSDSQCDYTQVSCIQGV